MSVAEVLQPVALSGPARETPAVPADLAAVWACTPALWTPLVDEVPGQRSYARLFPQATHGLAAHAWLITWAPGAAIDLHHHGDAGAAVAIVRGTLTERFTDRTDPAPLVARRLPPGSIVAFGADHLHEIRNAGPTAAVSLHVYSASLDGMTFYDPFPELAPEPRPDPESARRVA